MMSTPRIYKVLESKNCLCFSATVLVISKEIWPREAKFWGRGKFPVTPYSCPHDIEFGQFTVIFTLTTYDWFLLNSVILS